MRVALFFLRWSLEPFSIVGENPTLHPVVPTTYDDDLFLSFSLFLAVFVCALVLFIGPSRANTVGTNYTRCSQHNKKGNGDQILVVSASFYSYYSPRRPFPFFFGPALFCNQSCIVFVSLCSKTSYPRNGNLPNIFYHFWGGSGGQTSTHCT